MATTPWAEKMNRVNIALMVSMKEPILQRTGELGAQTISFISAAFSDDVCGGDVAQCSKKYIFF